MQFSVAEQLGKYISPRNAPVGNTDRWWSIVFTHAHTQLLSHIFKFIMSRQNRLVLYFFIQNLLNY